MARSSRGSRNKDSNRRRNYDFGWQATADNPVNVNNFLVRAGFKLNNNGDDEVSATTSPSSTSFAEATQSAASTNMESYTTLGLDTELSKPSKWAPAVLEAHTEANPESSEQGNNKGGLQNQLPIDKLAKTLRSSSLGKGANSPTDDGTLPAARQRVKAAASANPIMGSLPNSANKPSVKDLEGLLLAREALQERIRSCTETMSRLRAASEESTASLEQSNEAVCVKIAALEKKLVTTGEQVKRDDAEIIHLREVVNATKKKITALEHDKTAHQREAAATRDKLCAQRQGKIAIEKDHGNLVTEVKAKTAGLQAQMIQLEESLQRVCQGIAACETSKERTTAVVKPTGIPVAEPTVAGSTVGMQTMVTTSAKLKDSSPVNSGQDHDLLDDIDLEDITGVVNEPEVKTRRVILRNIPQDANATAVFSLIHSGRIQDVQWVAGSKVAEVTFVNPEACKSFLAASKNGIRVPNRENAVVGVEIKPDAEADLPSVSKAIVRKQIRCVRVEIPVASVKASWTAPHLNHIAVGHDLGLTRRVEAILRGTRTEKAEKFQVFVWRFFSIAEAVDFRDWLEQEFSDIKTSSFNDPCEGASEPRAEGSWGLAKPVVNA